MRHQRFVTVGICLASLWFLCCGDDEGDLENTPIGVVKESSVMSDEEPKVPEQEEVNIPEQPDPELEPAQAEVAEVDRIEQVMQRFRGSYEKEDVDAYILTFWERGFGYAADLATDDPKDDVEFDDLRMEKESAERVFADFDDIQIEMSVSNIQLTPDGRAAEATNQYEILGSALPGRALEGGFTTWLAAGKNKFTLELRNGEWRITEWIDEALSLEEIVEAHKDDVHLEPQPPKLATTWGHIKTR